MANPGKSDILSSLSETIVTQFEEKNDIDNVIASAFNVGNIKILEAQLSDITHGDHCQIETTSLITTVKITELSLDEALVASKAILRDLKTRVHVTIVFAIYEEINRMVSGSIHPNGEDFIREKIKQMDTFSDCPNFSWDMLIIDDGCPMNSGVEAQQILKQYSEETQKCWPVSVLFLANCLKEGLCPANVKLESTNESIKGGAIYYGLWQACQCFIADPAGSGPGGPDPEVERLILYTDADLSAHLGQIGFAVDKIINHNCDICIGSRKLIHRPSEKASFKAASLWCYIWSNLFPGLQVTDTQVGFKAFRSELLTKVLNRPLIEHGLCFDLELLVLANQMKPNCIMEFPLIWFDSIPESKTRQMGKDVCFFQMVQALAHLYEKYGQQDAWRISFKFLINSLDMKMLDMLLNQCPSELLKWSSFELLTYKGVTAFELAALSCKSDPVKVSLAMDMQWTKMPQTTDCWYHTDDPDAVCSARLNGEKCPLTMLPSLSNEGVAVKPVPVAIDIDDLKKTHKTIFDNLNAPFDPAKFSNVSSPPVSVGFIENEETFSKWGPVPQPQNMPIKMPFTDYRLPRELSQFEEVVQKVANYWHTLNSHYGDYYFCYLSVSQSNVPSNCYQRRGHLHSDGFQSSWLVPKLPSDFSFVVSNVAPTEYFLQSFDVSDLDPKKLNYYKHFAKHIKSQPLRLQKPFEIIMMDSYTVHKAIKNETEATFQRTFLRFIFSVIRWDRKGNARNPMFDYEWPAVERNMMDVLL